MATLALGLANATRSPRTLKFALRFLSVGIFLIAWEIFARLSNSLLIPTFVDTLAALVHLLMSPTLWQALWLSNQAMVLGFALAAIFGTALGLLIGRWRAAEQFVDPYLNMLLVLPTSALIPVLIMATGLGIVTRVLVVFWFAVVVIVVNTRAGLRTLDPAWVEMARSFGATERQLWRKIFLRGALPAIMAGMRLGIARAISGMLTVELLVLAIGVGRLILDFQGRFESAYLYAVVFVVVCQVVLLMQLVRWLERGAAPWKSQEGIE
jgi:NitT/TauT family transport system permease protein